MAHRVDSHGFSKYHSLYASLSSPMLKNVSGKLLPGTLEDPTVIFNVRQLPSLFSQIVDIAMKLRESMLRHLPFLSMTATTGAGFCQGLTLTASRRYSHCCIVAPPFFCPEHFGKFRDNLTQRDPTL